VTDLVERLVLKTLSALGTTRSTFVILSAAKNPERQSQANNRMDSSLRC